ncbi:MAG: methyltransferase domain-containing protein [Lachnospiraceae bacterium]|nr:methyltransferase domain-containing protein [Lachnospiraceae bacterium]
MAKMKYDLKRLKRHLRVIRDSIVEKSKGLDFSMMKLTDNHFPKNKSSNYYGYFMTTEDTIHEGLSRVPVKPAESNFLDVGCGKGICLKVACEYGFRKVAGIEFMPDIAAIAKKNMSILKLPAEVFEANALYFDKYADYDVFYFYNPFNATIFKDVIAAIDKSLTERPRTIYVIYTSPTSHQLWMDAGFALVDGYTDQNRGTQVNIYKKSTL